MAVTKKQQVNIVHHWHCWATTHCGVWLTSTGPESRLGPKLKTLPESQISMHTLIRPYESQGRFKKQKNKKLKTKTKNNKENKKGCYRRLVEYASPEGKLEALHMINENYFAVDEALQEMQRAFLELHPECLADNAPGENAPESSEAMAE